MKYTTALLFLFIFTGCADCTIQREAAAIKNPTGEEVFTSFFNAFGTRLDSSEPMCALTSIDSGKPMTLGDFFALALSSSYDNPPNMANVVTNCKMIKHELKNGHIVDVWDCNIGVIESNNENSFIASTNITFSLDLHTYKYISPSLRCN